MEARSLSLRECFSKIFEPTYLAGAAPATIREYRSVLARWDELIGDLAVDAIDTLTLSRFRAGLMKGRSVATVNKCLRHVNAVLAKLGPAGPGNRDALGVLERVAWIKPLKELRRLPRRVTDQQIAAAYDACRFALKPRGLLGIKPAAWWRAVIVVAYTTGFRHGAIMSLRWSDVDLVSRSIGIEAEHDKCGCERRKPLHEVAVRHLLAVRSKYAEVFPWNCSSRSRFREWSRILDHTDLEAEEHFGLHDLKRTAGSRYAGCASPWAVQTMLDHSSLATARHYVNPVDELRDAVEALPVPACFSKE